MPPRDVALVFMVVMLATTIAVGTASVIGFPYGFQSAGPTSAGQLGEWVRTTPYPLNMSMAGPSCAFGGGYAYCVGGNDGTATNATYFAPLSSSGVGSWQRTEDYPVDIQNEECLISNSVIYCMGGVIGAKEGPSNNITADIFYAPVSSSGIGPWTETTPLPHIEASPMCMTSGEYVYCLSLKPNGTGTDSPKGTGTGFTLVPAAYFAHLSSNGVGAWSPTTAPPTMTAGCSSISGHAYCFGGGSCPLSNFACPSPSYYAALSSGGIGNWTITAGLPNRGYANYVTAESYIYYLEIPLYVAPASSDGIGPWVTTTNFPNSAQPSTCVSSGAYIYCVSGTPVNGQLSNYVYYAEIGGPNPNALHLENPPPFQNAEYLGPAWNPNGSCSVSAPPIGFSGAPCFTYDIDEAVVFNCGLTAATPSGCKTTVASPGNPIYDFNLTIWYPDLGLGQSPPQTNCAYLLEVGSSTPSYAWCISVGPDSFIVSQPVLPILPA